MKNFANRFTLFFIDFSVIFLMMFVFRSSIYSSNKATNTYLPKSVNIPQINGYIAEFKNSPVTVHLKTLSNETSKTKINIESSQYLDQLLIEHRKAKKDITTRIGNSEMHKILQEYYFAFNGIALDVSPDEAQKIKQSPFIKNIQPNYTVKSALISSVPLVHADKVWSLRDGLGKSVTGQSINVGVIDTGVDYTHVDLGHTLIQDRPFEKVAAVPNSNPYELPLLEYDYTITLDQGRLAYINGNKINIFTFSTKTTREVNLLKSNLTAIRISLKGNILAYYAVEMGLSPAVYYYNLDTNEHKKIDETIIIRTLLISNEKIFYDKDVPDAYSPVMIYDVKSGTISMIDKGYGVGYGGSAPLVSGDQLAFSIVGSSYCSEKLVTYNLDTGQKTDYYPPYIRDLSDFDGNKILYRSCENPNNSTNIFYLYDLSDRTYLKITFGSSTASSAGEVKSNYDGYFFSWPHLTYGFIENGLIYFYQTTSRNIIIAYDQILQRYVKINLNKSAWNFTSEGNKVCFTSDDFSIYCHDYDSAYSYSLPTNIFNNKVISGYNFIDGNNDPLDDNGHGTHVTSIIAGNGSMQGVAPGANIAAYKVLDYEGYGKQSDVLAAIDKAVNTLYDDNLSNDIRVLNLSLGVDCQDQGGVFNVLWAG